ncbi:MAG: efflux RND transporter periplasmic adaptor subunit [Myxococcota bacterium]|nr:efflux RND transporter periplasmic adaptor subunit [Myxococcota bacterium]
MSPLFALTLACASPEPQATQPPAALEDRIAWAQPTAVREVPIATLFAQVVSGPDGAIALSPGVSGRILSWRVAPGAHIQAGDPLAVLVSPELSDLTAQVQSLQAQLTQSRALLATREQEHAAGLISLSALRESQSEVQRLEAELSAQDQRLKAHQDGLARSGQSWTWRARVSGTVSSLGCPVGNVDSADRCLTVLAEGGDPLLELSLPERYLDHAQGPLRAEFVAEGGQSSRFTELSRTPTLDPRTRAQTLRFSPTGEAPLPGRSGRATLWSPQEAVGVPPQALSLIDGGDVVFVQGAEGPEPREVTLLGASETQRFISGVSPDEQVAVQGVFLLKSLLLSEAL